MQVGQVIELDIVAKHPFNKGFEKAALQPVAQWRAAKAQCGVDRQAPFGQQFDPLIQRVDETIGLAQTQR